MMFLAKHFQNKSAFYSQKRSKIRVLALVPSYFGYSGEAINERQLLNALSHKVASIWVITLVGFKQIFTVKKHELKINRPHNIIVVPIPSLQFSPLFVAIVCTLISFIFALFASILNTFRELHLIYIRTSKLSLGFMLMASLNQLTVVKIPAMIEDETIDDGFESRFMKILSSYLDKFVILKSKQVAVLNYPLSDFLMKRGFVKPKQPWLILPAGVNLNLIKRIKQSKELCNFKDNPYRIGFVGSLAVWQGVDVLVQAVSKVKDVIPNIKLIIVGDGPMREKIRKTCELHRINYLITGYISHEKALNYLKNCDILVLPRKQSSTTESIVPIKVIEAFALGVPVIVTPHKILRQMYTDGEDLVYAEPHPEDVAKKIILLISDEKLMEKLKRSGPLNAKKFDYGIIANTLLNPSEKKSA